MNLVYTKEEVQTICNNIITDAQCNIDCCFKKFNVSTLKELSEVKGIDNSYLIMAGSGLEYKRKYIFVRDHMQYNSDGNLILTLKEAEELRFI